MVDDVVRALGLLTLGSRFRRLGERLQSDTQRIIDELGMPVQASQFPFLAAIDRAGPLTIGELAEAVGITQPGATRTLAQLSRQGLLAIAPTPSDQRRKSVMLTEEGQRLVDFAKANAFPRIAGAVADLCADLEGPLLDQLAAIEERLAENPLVRRGAPGRPVA